MGWVIPQMLKQRQKRVRNSGLGSGQVVLARSGGYTRDRHMISHAQHLNEVRSLLVPQPISERARGHLAQLSQPMALDRVLPRCSPRWHMLKDSKPFQMQGRPRQLPDDATEGLILVR